MNRYALLEEIYRLPIPLESFWDLALRIQATRFFLAHLDRQLSPRARARVASAWRVSFFFSCCFLGPMNVVLL